jgi:hypothetical protein
MAQVATDVKEQAHALIDRLAPGQLAVVVDLLKVMMVEPLSHSLARVPVEDEELTEETMAALNRASDSLDRGESVSHEEVLDEFGL